ncbi:hypothetical protein H4S02_002315 [Coemansia sp. RSA 2611]|uniref:Arrestin-like N-terminal domain-containing protein n=2 Tax=Coemansia TaxID=4863 RepID=A0A9W8GHE1_9FUNG|nr:hypothetical protein H4S02_002315 [Coemansia sp. RSA 2611]KAJ2686480.1 hypothetical protein IWW39_003596 [Coemansia spiralis]
MRPTTLSILLDSPAVHLFGERTTSAGVVLTGTVRLGLRAATKIRQLHLTFSGELAISYVPRHHSSAGPATRNKRLAKMTQDLILFSVPKLYAAGIHDLRFAFVLPGDLPPTAELLFGHISYSVQAQLVLTGLRSNCVSNAPVVILRCPGEGSQWAHSAFDALSVGTQWDGRLSAEVTHGSCSVPADSTLVLGVEVCPSEKGFSLIALEAVLKEIQSIYASADDHEGAAEAGSVVYRESRLVARKRLAFGTVGTPLDGQNEYDVELLVPPAFAGVQYECESADIKVSHQLALTALVKTPEGLTIEVVLPAHLFVLPQVSLDGVADLPLYELSGDDQLVQSAEPENQPEIYSQSSSHSSHTAIDSQAYVSLTDLPPYSLPVCLSCGKEDISVLQCRRAIVSKSQIPPNAEIEDMCADL